MDPFEKSQTVDPEVRAHIYSLVSAIGGASTVDDGRYVLGDDALACLKDLRRWLKLYDTKLDRYDVKRCLVEANVVKGDLLEILSQWSPEHSSSVLRRKVALASLEILCQLTWPYMLEADRTTVNHMRHVPVLRLAQVEYKRSVLQHDDLLRNIVDVVLPSLSIPKNERSPRDEGVIQMVLYFLRNIAAISQPSDLPVTGDENDVSRAATIHAFHSQDILNLLLSFCSGVGEDFVEQDVILLDILFQLIKGIDHDKLFAGDQQVLTDRNNAFKVLISKERAMMTSYARNAPSRHNRFGSMIWLKRGEEQLHTVSGQNAIINDQQTLQKIDSSKKWNKPKPRGKKTEDVIENADFLPVDLDLQARQQLGAFVSEFIDSCFNPLFVHLRRAIEREQDRVKDAHTRQYYYLVSWFLRADTSRRQARAKRAGPEATAQETSFAYVATVLDQESFVLLNRTMQRNLDDKSWPDVHTCMLAFTQILSTVSAMADSPSEDDREISENHLNRFFYEQQTHDRVLRILRTYKPGTQSFGYLDACTEMAHVFFRTLERYSKVNVDMYIRYKRKARKKAKAAARGDSQPDGPAGQQPQSDEEDEEANAADAREEVKERKLDVGRLSARFVNGGCIDTFVHYTRYYLDLDKTQLKRCHRFFYRVAFKTGNPILLYRLDILNLFHRMLKGPDGLDSWLDRSNPTFREWEELVRHVFRKCIKKIQERPELIAEILFTKMSNSLYFLEHGREREIVQKVSRAPAELEIKPGMDEEAQVGVAVGILIDQGKLDHLHWVKQCLSEAVDERGSWEDMHIATRDVAARDLVQNAGHEACKDDGVNDEPEASNHDATTANGIAETSDAPRAPMILMRPDSDERRIACFKDKFLRLLLKTLSILRMGGSEDSDITWMVPSELSSAELAKSVELITKFEYDPPTYDDGKAAEAFVRNVVVRRTQLETGDISDDDDDGDSEIDESLFVPGGPTERRKDYDVSHKKRRRLTRRGSITEEEKKLRAAARRRKDKEKDAKIKSALFITASDDEDDDERDAQFFEMEASRRKQTAAEISELAAAVSVPARSSSTKVRKRQSDGTNSNKRRKTVDSGTEITDGSHVDSSSSDDDISSVEQNQVQGRQSSNSSPASSQDQTMAILEIDIDNEAMDADDDRPVLELASGNRGRHIVDDDD